MASEAAQNFLQPLSSWMSQIYQAIQQAGDSISASLLNLSGVGRKSEEERNQDLENNGGVYEDYSEESDDERHLDQYSGGEYLYSREDGHISHDDHRGPDLPSQDLPHGSDMGPQRQKWVKNTSSLPEQCVESTRSSAANGSYWMNEDLQPLDQLPPIAEEEGEPSVRMGGHEYNLSLGGSLKSNNSKASF
ncbi:SYT16 protein, partial [Pedionomus torquatus]|nr:SYT16 protein [Pedionomus torquatus]